MENSISLYPFIIGFIILYCVVLFFDTIFKTCMFYPYLSFMDQMGITIRPYVIVWSITRFNRAFFRMGNFMPRLMKRWFNVGYYCTVIAIFVSLGFLLLPIIRYLGSKMPFNNYEQTVVSVIPGITTPFSHIVYIIPALAISMVFHEFGHALAASREKIPVDSCGVAWVLVFPAAFVNLPHSKISLCSHQQQLRVYCAGVWHNFVLVILGLFFIYYAPFAFYPGIKSGIGVTIMDIKQTSSLAHHGGFKTHDVVTFVNDCNIKSEESWYDCLADVKSSPQLGFCSSKEFIQTYGNISHCCTNSPEHLCFEYTDNDIKQYVCLVARTLIDKTSFCKDPTECHENLCLIPHIPSTQEKLVKFERQDKKSVLFIGSIEELVYSVKVSSWVSYISFPSIEFVIHIENFFRYLAGISAGLLVMNVVPCYYLDGGYIIENIVELYGERIWRPAYRNILIDRFKAIGFLLIALNVMMGINNLIKEG